MRMLIKILLRKHLLNPAAVFVFFVPLLFFYKNLENVGNQQFKNLENVIKRHRKNLENVINRG